MECVRIVTFDMFTWVVRCSATGEGDMRERAESLGGLLYNAVGLCHGLGLVDVDVIFLKVCCICNSCFFNCVGCV